MAEHVIIVHAFVSDEDGDHYLDDRVPVGTPVRWTAYERIIRDESEPHESPWEADADTFAEIEALVRARADEVGLDPNWGVRVEHYPEDIYA